MSRSFNNFLARRQGQEFTHKFSKLCENIARSGISWDDYCRNQLYPTLVEGNYQSPDDLLELLNEARVSKPNGSPSMWNLWNLFGNKGKPAQDPTKVAPTKGDNWRDMGYPNVDAYNVSPPAEKEKRRKQAAAQVAGQPPAVKKKSGVNQQRLDQETKLYQSAAQNIQGRFKQALQQFYNMVRDDAHKTNNHHQYEVLRHFMKKIEPAYQQALTGLKAKSSNGNEIRNIFNTTSRQGYDSRQADRRKSDMAGINDISKSGGPNQMSIGAEPGYATRATMNSRSLPPEMTNAVGTSVTGGDFPAEFGPTSQTIAGSGDHATQAMAGNMPVGSDVSPDTKQAVINQSGGYAQNMVGQGPGGSITSDMVGQGPDGEGYNTSDAGMGSLPPELAAQFGGSQIAGIRPDDDPYNPVQKKKYEDDDSNMADVAASMPSPGGAWEHRNRRGRRFVENGRNKYRYYHV